jgi:uncharacterized membrane protein
MKTKDKRLTVILKALWIYFTLLWGYIAIENLIYPSMVYSSNFSYYIPIKTDLLGILAFCASFVFFILQKLY